MEYYFSDMCINSNETKRSLGAPIPQRPERLPEEDFYLWSVGYDFKYLRGVILNKGSMA